jgi:hypothetical protein
MAAVGQACIVDRDDVRVSQLREDFGFAHEAGFFGGLCERAPGQHLDRDFTAGRFLLGQINDALRAAVDFTNDAIAADAFRDGLGKTESLRSRRRAAASGFGFGPMRRTIHDP